MSAKYDKSNKINVYNNSGYLIWARIIPRVIYIYIREFIGRRGLIERMRKGNFEVRGRMGSSYIKRRKNKTGEKPMKKVKEKERFRGACCDWQLSAQPANNPGLSSFYPSSCKGRTRSRLKRTIRICQLLLLSIDDFLLQQNTELIIHISEVSFA